MYQDALGILIKLSSKLDALIRWFLLGSLLLVSFWSLSSFLSSVYKSEKAAKLGQQANDRKDDRKLMISIDSGERL